ncbi:MAG: hypothetical protein J6P61_07510 [Erysipelotrichaceae bacterium]|nr:hypothetical protein [Erysipelotrichaceae bacterium]
MKFKSKVKIVLVILVLVVLTVLVDKHETSKNYIPTVTAVNGEPGKVTIKWEAAAGVKSYDIYRQERVAIVDKTFSLPELIGTTTETEYVDDTMVEGNMYQYYVEGKRGSVIVSSKLRLVPYVNLEAPKIKDIKTTKSSVSISFETVDTRIYQLMKENDKGEYEVVKEEICSGDSHTFTDTGLESGKTYKYKIRRVRYKHGKIVTLTGHITDVIKVKTN